MTSEELNPIHISDLLDGPTEIDWVVEGIIPPGSSGILAGDAGVGKTWFGLDLALSIARGEPWLGKYPTRLGPVLMVDEENADLLLRVRLIKMLESREADASKDPIHFLIGEQINISETMKDDEDELTRWEQLIELTTALKPILVIFDSLTRVHRANENSSNEMSEVFGRVRTFIDTTKSAVIFTHHVRKGGGSFGDRIRGSTDIRAFADYTLVLEKTNDEIALTPDKSRWDVTLPATKFKLTTSENDGIEIMYSGEYSKQPMKEIWSSIFDAFEGEDHSLSRQDLIQIIVEEQSLCKTRKLDEVLAWRADHEYLEKSKQGKTVVYKLGEEAIREDYKNISESDLKILIEMETSTKVNS